MKVVYVEHEKSIKKTKKELLEELSNYRENDPMRALVSKYKRVPAEEPTYTVVMSAKELQLVSFYLELENRKPIMNVEIDAEIKKEQKNNKKEVEVNELQKKIQQERVRRR